MKRVIYIKPKKKYKHLKLIIHKEFDKCQLIELTIENLDINYVDREFSAYVITIKKHNKNMIITLSDVNKKLIFNDNQYSPYVTSKLFDNKKMIARKSF